MAKRGTCFQRVSSAMGFKPIAALCPTQVRQFKAR